MIEARHQQYLDIDQTYRHGQILETDGGVTGYVDWENGPYAIPGIRTARMKVENRIFDIEVSKKKLGIGQKLLSELVKKLIQEKYQCLLILGATQSTKEFYDKVLKRLVDQGDVETFSAQERVCAIEHCVDYIYIVFLRLN